MRWARPRSHPPISADPDADQCAVANLFAEETGEHRTCRGRVLLSNGKRDEHHQERNSEAVVEASLNIERLADFLWHSLAVHDHLTEAGIGRGEDGGQNARFRPRQSAQHDDRACCP